MVAPALAHGLMRLVAEGAGEGDEAADAELRAQAATAYLRLPGCGACDALPACAGAMQSARPRRLLHYSVPFAHLLRRRGKLLSNRRSSAHAGEMLRTQLARPTAMRHS